MNISKIKLTNLVLQTRKGIECSEATNIQFNNIRLVTAEADPLIYLQNATSIEFNDITVVNPASVLFSVNGEKSKNIKVSKIRVPKATTKVVYQFGANASSIEFK